MVVQVHDLNNSGQVSEDGTAIATPRKGSVEWPDDDNTMSSEPIANAGGLSDLAYSSRNHIPRSINGQVGDEIYDLDHIQAGKTWRASRVWRAQFPVTLSPTVLILPHDRALWREDAA